MFELQKNLSNTEISHIKYEGDKLHDDMKSIPEFLPKKNFSFYIVGRPKSGKSTLLHHLLCSDGRKIKNKNLHKPKFYYKQFDKVIIFSPSIKTSSKPFPLTKKNIYDEYNPELLQDVIEEIQDENQNQNVCMVFDGVIKNLQKGGENAGRVLHKLLLNRRHIFYNEEDDEDDHISGCSSIITSQRYNLLPLYIRSSGISHLMLFKITNQKDLQDVWIETANELTFPQFKKICDWVWGEPHSFVYMILDEDITMKFHKNFDRIILNEEYLNT